jgi:starch phosphorylase
MNARKVSMQKAPASSDGFAKLLQQYGCGPIPFSGDEAALYERHLVFDQVISKAAADSRDRYEALARSVRDILAQRWAGTEETYDRENPKRIYYLSMEFLIGRSLANNITNLLLDPYVQQAAESRDVDWLGLLEEEPDAGLGNGGLGRLAACFLDSMATMQLPAMGYGLRVRVRNIPTVDSRRLAAGAARQLAAAPRPLGSRSTEGAGRSLSELLI